MPRSFAEDLKAARGKAPELTGPEQAVSRLRAEHKHLRHSQLSLAARNRLRAIERETVRLAEQLALDAGLVRVPDDFADEADRDGPPAPRPVAEDGRVADERRDA